MAKEWWKPLSPVGRPIKMKKFDYKKLVRASVAWFEPGGEELRWHGPRKTLEDFVKTPSHKDFGKVLNRIDSIAAWHARQAVIEIGDQNYSAGWESMKRYVDYNFATFFLSVERVKLSAGRGSQHADPTLMPFHLVTMLLSFKNWNQAGVLGEVLAAGRESLLLGYDWSGKRRDSFRCYVWQLYSMLTALGESDDNSGPYRAIFDAWAQEESLSSAITAACDYHVEQINVKDPDDIGVFENNPHDIFPAEILALYRVREQLGLSTPKVDHPLLDSPFCDVPENIIYEPDPLIEQSVALARSLLPELVAARR
jgi:hypothetical protein